MRESTIEKATKNYARSKGLLPFKFSSPSNRGVPDCLLISSGTFFFIEFKAPGKTPSPLQESVIKKIRAHGAVVYVVDSIELGETVVNYYVK